MIPANINRNWKLATDPKTSGGDAESAFLALVKEVRARGLDLCVLEDGRPLGGKLDGLWARAVRYDTPETEADSCGREWLRRVRGASLEVELVEAGDVDESDGDLFGMSHEGARDFFTAVAAIGKLFDRFLDDKPKRKHGSTRSRR